MKDHLGFYKSWASSFPIGQIIFKAGEPYAVESVGTDFLVLKSAKDGAVVKLFRNTPESYEFTAAPGAQKGLGLVRNDAIRQAEDKDERPVPRL